MSAPTVPTRRAAHDLGPVTTVAEGFTLPSALAFGDDGAVYVADTRLRPERSGRVWRLGEAGERTLLSGAFVPPITGLAFRGGSLWVSQGGPPGRISRLDPDGSVTHVLTDLPGGDHHVGEVTFGPDGKLYFGLGALTNTGIIGLDTLANGWQARQPAVLDVPGYDIVLRNVRVRTSDPHSDDPTTERLTGPFSPFGEVVQADTHILGARLWGWPLATAAVHRADPDGSGVELVCWGLRNPFGLRFLPDGRLIAIDQGADDRGSRPIGGVPDFLWEVRDAAWYGWPDYFGGRPVTDPAYRPSDGSIPTFVLANHDELPRPERPLTAFPGGVSATALDVDPASAGRVVTVALETGPRSAGCAIVLVRTTDGAQHVLHTSAFADPVALRYHPADGALWIVDSGVSAASSADGRRRGRVLRVDDRPSAPPA
ncbi:PQQ-dependent sugar dehydrogenase [Cryptosporangium minutisporangium]|uniref:Sugar dehydrogenase n=1 Tax=Cryptosporangium minutisporangium TaxID=113569 RepID=A0ABP6TDJ0_9ACTN